jgi:hypothetical protein
MYPSDCKKILPAIIAKEIDKISAARG